MANLVDVVVTCSAALCGVWAYLGEQRAAKWEARCKEVECRVAVEAQRKREASETVTRIATGMLSLHEDIDRAYLRQMDEAFVRGQSETIPVIDRLWHVGECMGCDNVIASSEPISRLTLCDDCQEHGVQPMPASPVVQQSIVMIN